MKGTNLGEFEELVLLTIAAFNEKAYGVLIKHQIEERTGRKVSMGAMYSALSRLEEKDFISSFWGEATRERGGKRKKFFKVEASGRAALIEAKKIRDDLWTLSGDLLLSPNISK